MIKHQVTSPKDILNWITDSQKSVTYSYIIMGKSGPTGKTWLYSQLKERGYDVTELSEYIIGEVDYKYDDRNTVIVNEIDGKIIIILNKPIMTESKRFPHCYY